MVNDIVFRGTSTAFPRSAHVIADRNVAADVGSRLASVIGLQASKMLEEFLMCACPAPLPISRSVTPYQSGRACPGLAYFSTWTQRYLSALCRVKLFPKTLIIRYMSDISFSDLAASAGSTTGNYLKDIANGAADFACGLYHNHQGWVVNQLDPTGISTGFGDGLMKSLCTPRPGYVPPVQPDPGYPPQYALCPGFWSWNMKFDSYPDIYSQGQGGLGEDKPVLTNARTTIVMGASGSIYYDAGANHDKMTLSNVTYVPSDQTCNQPSPNPVIPTIPTSNDLSTHTTVNNISVPISYVGANASFGLKINVGGVNVRFDHNGATLNDFSDNSTNVLNNQQVSQLAIQSNQTSNVLTQVNNNLNTLVFAPSGVLIPTVNLPGQGGSKTAISGMRIVTITLTRWDLSKSSSYGGERGGIYKAGYFEFKHGDFAYPGDSIRYAHSVFVAPPGADGFTFYMFGIFEGYATEYTL